MEINGYEIDNYNQFGLKTELKMMFAHFVLLIEKRKQINVFRFIGIQVFSSIIAEKKGNYIHLNVEEYKTICKTRFKR
jgi:hypothetical protein